MERLAELERALKRDQDLFCRDFTDTNALIERRYFALIEEARRKRRNKVAVPLDYLKRHAEAGDAISMAEYAESYLASCDYECRDLAKIKQRISHAFTWYKKAAEAGSTAAMIQLAFWYKCDYFNQGSDVKKAASLIERAAKLGDDEAWFILGSGDRGYFFMDLSLDNRIFKQYHDAAVGRFTSLAEKGNRRAMYYLAQIFCHYGRRKQITHRIRQKYFCWLKKAAEAGHIEGMYRFGSLYYLGMRFFVKQDMDAAAYWNERAAIFKHFDATLNMAKISFSGTPERKKDLDAVEHWLERALDLCDGPHDLADVYRVKKDLAQAAEYEKAAQKGDKKAIETLANWYKGGCWLTGHNYFFR